MPAGSVGLASNSCANLISCGHAIFGISCLAEDDSRALSNAAEVCCHSPLLESASMIDGERPWRQVPGPDFVPGDSWLPECRVNIISDLAAKTVRESDWARCCSSAGAWRVWCQCCSGWESMWGSLRLETAQISFAINF